MALVISGNNATFEEVIGYGPEFEAEHAACVALQEAICRPQP